MLTEYFMTEGAVDGARCICSVFCWCAASCFPPVLLPSLHVPRGEVLHELE